MYQGLRSLPSDFTPQPKGCCYFCCYYLSHYIMILPGALLLSGNQLVPGKCANQIDVALWWKLWLEGEVLIFSRRAHRFKGHYAQEWRSYETNPPFHKTWLRKEVVSFCIYMPFFLRSTETFRGIIPPSEQQFLNQAKSFLSTLSWLSSDKPNGGLQGELQYYRHKILSPCQSSFSLNW